MHWLPTLIIATVATKDQWREQFECLAPSLVLDRKVIIDTATKEWEQQTQFSRIIIDESHLLGTNSIRNTVVSTLHAERKWCFSTTPLGSKLEKQLEFLGLKEEEGRDPCSFYRKHMLRQTKSMLLGSSSGSATDLVLDPSGAQAVSMTNWERAQFEQLLKTTEPYATDHGKTKIKGLYSHWYSPLHSALSSSYGESSKFNQLRHAMESLRNKTRPAHAKTVIFTLFPEQKRNLVMVLPQITPFSVFSIDVSTTPTKAKEIIRRFESASSSSSALVMTINSESPGLTIPGVHMVFFMEPCLDPIHEKQLVGHMGKVPVTKYYFAKSCESQVIDLHRAIQQSLQEQSAISVSENYILGDTLLDDALNALDVESTWTGRQDRCHSHLCQASKGEHCSNNMCLHCCEQHGGEPCSIHGLCQSDGCMAKCSGPSCPNAMCQECCQKGGEKHCKVHRQKSCCGCNSAKWDNQCPAKMCKGCCKVFSCTVHGIRLPTKCLGCSSLPAGKCTNQCCGKCCLSLGVYPCQRHKKE